MTIKIDVLTNDGSPLGVTYKTINGDDSQIGVGGAELALLTMCEIWSKAGYKVTLYNDPRELGVSPFDQKPISAFRPNDKRDILIVFRSPNPRAIAAKGRRIWWSCDQYTVGRFDHFSNFVDQIVCISPHHQQYFTEKYNIKNTISIDLPVRLWEYEDQIVEKIPNRVLFSSVPERGLDVLWNAWTTIKHEVKDASLVITSDYRLWGLWDAQVSQHKIKWLVHNDIIYRGGISRTDLVREQLAAQVLAYPCTYEELFCISVAEASVAGAYPITSTMGALNTTNMGTRITGNPLDSAFRIEFAHEVINTLINPTLPSMQEIVLSNARHRFSPDRIKTIWDEEVFNK